VYSSSSGLRLTAMFADCESRQTLIHVHGTHGNYFSAGYINVLARACLDARINLLSINTSGHDGISEAYRGQEYTYVGGALSSFSEIVSDLDGAIQFAESFSDKIVLAGHSLGCDRIVFHARETGKEYPLILLSPCDSYRLHEIFLGKESVEDHVERVKKIKPRDKFELLPAHEFGIDNKTERYFIPISRDALLSIIDGPPFRLFRLGKPDDFCLPNRCLVCIGAQDKLQTASPEDMFAYMTPRFSVCDSFLSPNGDHEFAGAEHDLAGAIVSWVSK
jgi:hypothetical protein